MEILLIITERPDRLALHVVGRLPTEQLEHREQQLPKDKPLNLNDSCQRTNNKCCDPRVDYEWVHGRFSMRFSALVHLWFAEVRLHVADTGPCYRTSPWPTGSSLDVNDSFTRPRSFFILIDTCKKYYRTLHFECWGGRRPLPAESMCLTVCFLHWGQDECVPPPHAQKQRMSTVNTECWNQLEWNATTRNRKQSSTVSSFLQTGGKNQSFFI